MQSCKENVGSKAEKTATQTDEDAAVKASLSQIRNKLLVMSGKGGVGKTSASVNLALALAAQGFDVGLMDVDIHGPDVPRMLGLAGTCDLSGDGKLIPLTVLPNLKSVSIESLIPEKDSAIIWRGPMKFAAIKQFIGEVDWGPLDFLLIDSPPGTGDEPLTVAQTIADARAVIVTTPQEISLADVRKSISFCRTVKMAILGLIENMSGFICPHCGETAVLFGSGGGQRTALTAGIPFLGSVPFDPHLVTYADAGLSQQFHAKASSAAEAFLAISHKILELLSINRPDRTKIAN